MIHPTIKYLFLLTALLTCSTQSGAQVQSDKLTAVIQDNYSGMHSVLIAKGGKLVYENYFNGFTADSLHDTRSAFKSVTSLLLGIAIDKGFIKSVDEKVYTFLPEDQSFAADSLKSKITIKDLLEMRSGFDCDEWNDEKDCETAMTATQDWVKFCLQLPMKNPPGEVWAYTSCNPMLISGIISKASGLSMMAFAEKHLFGPLHISRYRWTVDPAGNGMTAGSFYIRPLDLVKLGELVLHQGRFRGRQLISEKWIKASTAATIPIPDFSFVKLSRSTAAEPQPAFYGYYWYNETVSVNGKAYPIIFASGNGGQYLMVIKKFNMVVVFTQGNFGSWKAKRAFDLLAKYIIPAYGFPR